MKRLSKAQAEALQHYANGDGAGESWAQRSVSAIGPLAFYSHERTLDSLERHGWIDANGITDAGRAALAKRAP